MSLGCNFNFSYLKPGSHYQIIMLSFGCSDATLMRRYIHWGIVIYDSVVLCVNLTKARIKHTKLISTFQERRGEASRTVMHYLRLNDIVV